MILIVCIDDQNGMAFNHRRQSQDRVLVERIEGLTADSKLRMAPYSQKLFSSSNILADDDYLIKADIDDYCFVEREDVKPYEDKIQKVIVFRWNRHYPSDLKFGIDLVVWCCAAEFVRERAQSMLRIVAVRGPKAPQPRRELVPYHLVGRDLCVPPPGCTIDHQQRRGRHP